MSALAPPPLGTTLWLNAGPARVEIAPDCGARLLTFDVGGRHVLRPSSGRARTARAPYDFAGFPLLPYSGPIFGGGFRFDGNTYALGRNVAAEPDATHGHAWQMRWQIAEQSADRVTLRCAYQPSRGHYPFAWDATLIYGVESDALSIDMSIRNADLRPIPVGMGFHPYFPRPPDTRLTFEHGGVWPPDSPDAVRQGPVAVGGLDFNAGRDLTGLVADRCYEHWPGAAVLAYADGTRTTITATPAFGKLQLYAPWYDPYVCVEPVTNANDGFNRMHLNVAGHGVVVLEPGKALSGAMRIACAGPNV